MISSSTKSLEEAMKKAMEEKRKKELIGKFITSPEMDNFIETLKGCGLVNTMNGKTPIRDDDAKNLMRSEMRKVLIMINMSSWHSSKESNVHHTSYDCDLGNNIGAKNIVSGTGGKKLCSDCPKDTK